MFAAIKEKINAFPYFKQLAFILAILLLIYAWKFGIEGLTE